MKISFKKVAIIITVYLCVIAAYSFLHYQNMRSELIQSLDQRLTTAIHSTRAILGKSFHDRAIDKDSISQQVDYQLGLSLYEFAKEIGIEYVYSMKEFDDEILFVVSSATEQEYETGAYQPAYFTKYPEMDEAIEQSFATASKQTAEYSDRWGSFRSVFIPFKTSANTTYVIGADISLAHVKAMVMKSVAYTFIFACFLGALLAPLILLLIKSMQREWHARYQSLFCDSLTGLPNRNQLMKDIEQSENTHLALIDIKKFSDVTNTFGPGIGVLVIKQFACRLNNFSHPKLSNYKSYRVDGDVFAILEDQVLEAKEVKRGTEKLIAHITDFKYLINNTDNVKLAVTVGGVNQKEDAFMLANMALEEARRRNVQSFVYDNHNAFLPEIYKKNLLLKQKLQLALEEDRLVPFYQPIISTQDQKIAKYECLARIINKHGEVEITPDVFLPVARRSRLYSEITRRMVAKSINAARSSDYIISINLSISDIMNDSTRHFLINAVKESGMNERIQFEILETEAIKDRKKVLAFISKIKTLGAKIGIDDLGRSYSNFDRVALLPVDFIKIDRSIIAYIEHDVEAQGVTQNIVKLAHRHKIKVTAEYCHNEATTKMASHLGVDYLQGFYLGKPSKNIQQSQSDIKSA